MIVMTTGLSGLMALMRRDEKAAASPAPYATTRPCVAVENRKTRTRMG